MTGLKKNLNFSVDQARGCIDDNHLSISVVRQCELLGISRSSIYYTPKTPSEYTLQLQRDVDEIYTRWPFFGTRKMTAYLNKTLDYQINRKRIQSVYRQLGIEAVYPKPNLSKRQDKDKIYPYLLRDVKIERCNQVWSTDITYIRLLNGFMYLVAIIDWHSRYVLSWSLSNSLDLGFCMESAEAVISQRCCEIFNTDQGSQFTSKAFTGLLLSNGIQISMDGRGRALDNIFVERLWRSVKYECVYLKEFKDVNSLRAALFTYFKFYNQQRPHQSLNYKTPAQVYFKEVENETV